MKLKKEKQVVYAGDFETNNSNFAIRNRRTYVWLWDLCNVDTLEHITGNTIDEFFDVLRKFKKSTTIYFHNLKFDGSFILDYMLKKVYKNGMTALKRVGDFKTIITDLGEYYQISVRVNSKVIVKFNDSSKKIQGSVESIAKSYKLPILKGKIDYKLHREEKHNATPEEIAYIHNDTEIIARVLKMLYDKGMTRLTSGSDTLNKYEKSVGQEFRIHFPELPKEEDSFIRESYKGGSVIVNEKYQGRILYENVYVFDINSSYPSVMCEADLPCGKPKKFKKKYVEDEEYPLYICKVEVNLKLKEDHMPCIMNKEKKISGKKIEYIIDTNNDTIELYLNNVDMKLMFENYDVKEIEYQGGLKFQSSKTSFKNFILPIYEKKCTTTGAEKQLYKIWLNALYGKFGKKPESCDKVPYLDGEVVKFKTGIVKDTKSIYTAISCFITSYGRQKLHNAINANIEYFVYCDTDSVHLTTKYPKGIEIDDNKLGAWKLEKVYTKSKYLGQKTYMGESEDGKLDVKIAGCQKGVKKYITFENFEYGNSYPGHLLTISVKGGKILVDGMFTLLEK